MDAPSNRITLPAFAKINLGLRVGGRRPDGYHELETIFQTVSLHDTIEITTANDSNIIFCADDRSLPADDNNLVVRAARALKERTASTFGVRLRLQKRIPTHAGLGGGSSNAAVTLIGLMRLWKLNLGRPELLEIAATLGADVPFFLYGGAALGRGVGDQIEALADTPETYLLIIKPNANVSTVAAYKALDERSLTTQNSKTILLTSEAKGLDTPNFASLQNDFEAVAVNLEPEIERAKIALHQAGARYTSLTGSGSAVFGVVDGPDAQRRAIQTIELETGWRVFPCKTVARGEYQAALSLGSAGSA